MPSFPHNVTFLPGLSPTVFPNTHLTPYGTFYGSAGFPSNGLVWNFTDNVVYAGAVHDSTAIGNDLMLHTGWYPSLDGIGDYINIPLGTQPANTRLRFLVKSTTDTSVDTGVASLGFVADGTWQRVEYQSFSSETWNLTLGANVGFSYNAVEISDVYVYSPSGDVVGHWLLNEHADELDAGLNGLPCFDHSGNGNHGEYVMCSGNVGEGAPVPQTALQDWNEYYRPLNEVAGTGWTWDFATGTLSLLATFTVARGFSIPPGISGNVVRITGNATVNDESPLFSLRTGTISGTVNSNLSGPIGTGEFEITLTATGSYEYLAVSEADFPATFIVENLRVWLPDGNYYIPEAQSNPGFDVLGNAIANPRGYLLNPRGESGDSITILEDASLALTTAMTITLVGNFYDTRALTQRFIDRWAITNRVFIVYRASTDSGRIRFILSSDGSSIAYNAYVDIQDKKSVITITYDGSIVRIFEDDEELEVKLTAGSVPASMYETPVGIDFGSTSDGAYTWDKQFLPPLMYNRVLTDDEHSDLYEKLQGLL
jgi:hypothetical protein